MFLLKLGRAWFLGFIGGRLDKEFNSKHLRIRCQHDVWFGSVGGTFSEGVVGGHRSVVGKQGAYVVLSEGEPCSKRLGQPLHIDLRLAYLKDVLSVRAKHPSHIDLLETVAFIFWLRWLIRTRAHHSRRAVILLDSAVLVGAAGKGRSSSGPRRVLRRVAALELAGDLQIYLVLVPSAYNPADYPSRGTRHGSRLMSPLAPCGSPASPAEWDAMSFDQ